MTDANRLQNEPPSSPGAMPALDVVVLVIGVLAAWAWQGPRLVVKLEPDRLYLVDFFQEWASGRYFLDGRSIYGPQTEAVRIYLDAKIKRRHSRDPFNEVNAHPPASILIHLPFALLDYQEGCLAWNLFSLATLPLSVWVVLRQLRIRPTTRTLLVFLILVPFCGPLHEQVDYGQLNFVLLFLIVGGWALARSGRPGAAGAVLALAASIKIFPAYLFLYYAVRREWKVVRSGLVSGVVIVALTSLVFGWEVYFDYLRVVPSLPEKYRGNWLNISPAGFWSRLFHAPAGEAVPLVDSPGLRGMATFLSGAAVVVLNGAAIRRARWQSEQDHAFAMTLIATLLLSPLAWPHYLLLLLLPMTLLARDLPQDGGRRPLFFVCLALMWIPVGWFWYLFLNATPTNWWYQEAKPWHSLTVLGLQTYALVAVFFLHRSLIGTGPGQRTG